MMSVVRSGLDGKPDFKLVLSEDRVWPNSDMGAGTRIGNGHATLLHAGEATA
jgi:hypothetical protein